MLFPMGNKESRCGALAMGIGTFWMFPLIFSVTLKVGAIVSSITGDIIKSYVIFPRLVKYIALTPFSHILTTNHDQFFLLQYGMLKVVHCLI